MAACRNFSSVAPEAEFAISLSARPEGAAFAHTRSVPFCIRNGNSAINSIYCPHKLCFSMNFRYGAEKVCVGLVPDISLRFACWQRMRTVIHCMHQGRKQET